MDVRQIGQYRIERELGQGGFGVYLATDTRLDRPAAVKQRRPELTANMDKVAEAVGHRFGGASHA